MTLIKSISGIRGTIGGKPGEGLTPIDIIRFSAAYGTWILSRSHQRKNKIVVGRDARVSGKMVNELVNATLVGLGIDVIDVGLSATPTVEIAVPEEDAQGGIVITASHNPKQWNALKLLNEKGEFISNEDGKELLEIAKNEEFKFAEVDLLGSVLKKYDYTDIHIKKIIELPEVDIESIKKANFKIVIDCVNSVGGIAIPELLENLGVQDVIQLYCEPNGIFPHNPEPLAENLADISKMVQENKASLGLVVDPDVDRLAIINEDGSMFGEEYTLVAVADYILQSKPGNTVSNLSSSQALRDITKKYGGNYYASAVGEVNVVNKMKEVQAVIGGEGNGGVILPLLHYGRDALVGIALFLSYLAKTEMKCSELRKSYPGYAISKNKIELRPDINVDEILNKVKSKYKNYNIIDIDGVKIEFNNEWVHLRKSNTEPIIRIYSESSSIEKANELATQVMENIKNLIN